MKRLIRKKQRSTIAFRSIVDLDCFYLDSGDVIGIASRTVNNKPWFQVYQEGLYNISSFYDGPDYESALRMYKDLSTSFKGVGFTENLSKSLPQVKSEIEEMLVEKKEDDYNFQKLKKNPLFLGVNDFE